MEFNNIYYFDEEKINSLYNQLPNNHDGISTETEKNVEISLSSTFKSIILKLAGINIDIDAGVITGKSNREIVTRKTNPLEKLFCVLKEIGEKDENNFKDIYYLIEKYLQNSETILSVGKGEFIFLSLMENKPSEIDGVEFPMDLDKLDCLLFSCEYEKESNQLNQRLEGKESYSLSEIVFPDDADITASIYSKRVFIIMEPSKIIDSFGLQYTANNSFYFLGRIVKTNNNYFIFPYALWGLCIIL